MLQKGLPTMAEQSSVNDRWLDIDGMRIHCLSAGEDGSAVVLIHGAGIDSASLSWELLIGPLAESHRVFAPDLPGYGQSDKPDVAYTMDFYIHFLERLLDALDLRAASLVGLSLGGGIALGFTLGFPERVIKLVPVDAYGLMPRMAFHRLSYLYTRTPLNELSYWLYRRSRRMMRASLLAALISSRDQITDALMDRVVEGARDPSAGKAFASFQRHDLGWKGLRTNYFERLDEISAPTLFVHGERDPAIPLMYAKWAQAQVKNARLYVMKGCLHWPMRDRPEEFNRVVIDFLRDS